MSIEIELRPLGQAMQRWDAANKVMALSPQFYRGEKYSIIAALTVKIGDKDCGEFMLRMSGKTGDLSLVDRTKTVEPPIVLLAKKGTEESKGDVPANTPAPK